MRVIVSRLKEDFASHLVISSVMQKDDCNPWETYSPCARCAGYDATADHHGFNAPRALENRAAQCSGYDTVCCIIYWPIVSVWILLLCFPTIVKDGLTLTFSARISNVAVYSIVHHRNHTGRIA